MLRHINDIAAGYFRSVFASWVASENGMCLDILCSIFRCCAMPQVFIVLNNHVEPHIPKSHLCRRYRRRNILCIELSVQCCTLRPKEQDDAPVYGAYKTIFPTVGGTYYA